MALRQCEFEFIDALKKDLESVEAVLSIACGVGVQTMSERHENKIAGIPIVRIAKDRPEAVKGLLG